MTAGNRSYFFMGIIALTQSFCCSAKQTKIHHDLVEIYTINPTIMLDIRYATKNNFTGQQVYPEARCFLRRKTAEKMNNVQKELKTMGLGLKIWDAYRPRSVQYVFWKLVPNPLYVGDPNKGSKHNLGAAVDCTLIDKDGKELIMPSTFDDFSKKAHRDYANMSPEAAKNCKLLEDIMVKHGFSFYYNEWWHFNDIDWRQYDLLDIPFSDL